MCESCNALGAIIGAAVGGASGAVIGRQMDKQAEEIEKTVPDAKVERVGEGIVVEFSSNILFGFDESNLSGDADFVYKVLVGNGYFMLGFGPYLAYVLSLGYRF